MSKSVSHLLLLAAGLIVIFIVLPQEHTLLDDYYTLMAKIPARTEETPTQIKTVGSFVRQVFKTLRNLSTGS